MPPHSMPAGRPRCMAPARQPAPPRLRAAPLALANAPLLRLPDLQLGMNKFADLSLEEYRQRLGFDGAAASKDRQTRLQSGGRFIYEDTVAPKEIDWREKGAVGPVKNQLLVSGRRWRVGAAGAGAPKLGALLLPAARRPNFHAGAALPIAAPPSLLRRPSFRAVRLLLGLLHHRRGGGRQRHCHRRAGDPVGADAGGLRHRARPRLPRRPHGLCV